MAISLNPSVFFTQVTLCALAQHVSFALKNDVSTLDLPAVNFDWPFAGTDHVTSTTSDFLKTTPPAEAYKNARINDFFRGHGGTEMAISLNPCVFFTQLVTEGTRVTQSTDNVLDLIFVGNFPEDTTGLQIAAAGTVFNLEDKIKAYAERLAQYYKTKVVWWDTHGEKLFHPKEKYSFIGVGLGGGLGRIIVAKQLERFKLNIKTGPVVYGNVSTASNTSTVLCTEWIEASHGPVKTTFTKSKQHTRKSSWNSQLSISTGFDISLSATLPMGLGGSSKYYTEMKLTAGVAGEYIESETLSIKHEIKTPPNTSFMIEWMVIDEVRRALNLGLLKSHRDHRGCYGLSKPI
uniref:Putative cytotoxin-like protein n=1 Tax=Ixodes ricinus TaxID=34613 RepID=A0A147BF38_IXORI